MKHIKETNNVLVIKSILYLENAYTNVCYDGSPSLKDFKPEGKWFILYEDNDLAGIINVSPLNNVLWTPHIFIFEKYRHNESEEWGKQVADYMVKHYAAQKFIAMTPYETAKRYAEKVGFKYITTLTKSIKKNGRLLDQFILEK